EIAKKLEEGIAGLDVGILINNAGLSYPFPRFLHEVDLEMAESIVRERCGDYLGDQGSFTGDVEEEKRFIAMMSRSISLEYKQHGIDIQCQVCSTSI
ncbi:hypothetical protein C3L33_13412, partial [Rhododendron williamsianum]